MATLILNIERNYTQNETSKYWVEFKCNPQKTKIQIGKMDDVTYYLEGIITDSHDKNQIGKKKTFCMQSYLSWMENKIKVGIYTIINE